MNRRSLPTRPGVSPSRHACTLHVEGGYPCRCEACLATTSYRLVRWVESQGRGHSLAARRAIVAMSVGWVSHAWLEREAGLGAKGVNALLETLKALAALETRQERPPAGPCHAMTPAWPPASPSVLHRLRRWWLSPMRPPG